MTILITGGSSGLGEAITRSCCRVFTGDRIFFTYNSSSEKAKKIEADYPNAQSVQCDFRNEESISFICNFITENNVDTLVNNAFTGLRQEYFHKTESGFFSESFNDNVAPVLKITQSFISEARKKKSGKIITILSSYVSNIPPLGLSLYVAEKNYLLAMHRSWAVENAKFKITSNCISPGFMLTPLNTRTDDRILETMISQHPLKALLEPSIVADTVIMLIESNVYLNGQNIFVNSALSV